MSPSRSSADRAEVGAAVAAEVVEQGERGGGRLRHRVHEVVAAARAGEHVRGEDALVDLEAALVLLQPFPLAVHGRAARKVVGEALGRRVDELGEAQR